MDDLSKLQELEHKHTMNSIKMIKICLTDGSSIKKLEKENNKIDKQIVKLRKKLGLHTVTNEELERILANNKIKK